MAYTINDYMDAISEMNSYDCDTPEFKLAKMKAESMEEPILAGGGDDARWMYCELLDAIYVLEENGGYEEAKKIREVLERYGYETPED